MSVTINCSWGCPNCGNINHDKHDSSEGVIDELECDQCGAIVDLSPSLEPEEVVEEVRKKIATAREANVTPSVVLLGRQQFNALKQTRTFTIHNTNRLVNTNQYELFGLRIVESISNSLIEVY